MSTQGAAVQTKPQSTGRRSLRRRILFVVIGLVVIVAAYAAYVMIRMNYVPTDLDDSTTRLSEASLYRVSFTSSDAPVPVNQLHTWTLHVETADGKPVDNAVIGIQGDMPQHGHGIPTKPQVTGNLGNGDYLVEGMKFQMGGWWVVDFTINANGNTDKVSFNLMLNK